MPESFGGRLRQQRERQGIALDTIADQTKIKLSLLEGLERDEVSHWPTGIFRRAFIRAYAHAIALEPDAVVREFLDRYPDPADIVAVDPSLRPDVDRVPEGVAPPTRFRYLVSSAIGTLAGRLSATAAERGRAMPVTSVIEPRPDIDRRHDIEPRRDIEPRHDIESPADVEPWRDSEPRPEIGFQHDDGFSVVGSRLMPVHNANAEPSRDSNREPSPDANAEPSRGVDIAASSEEIADECLTNEATLALDPTVEVESAGRVEVAAIPASPTVPAEPDFEAAAHVCTELGRAVHTHDVAPLLGRAAAVLDAVGLIVWAWDPQASALRAAVAHGYSDRVLAQLPAVRRDAANATAAAFRTAQPCSVAGDERASGALVAPLITPDGCVGVLAIEWPLGREQSASIRSMATIFAALVARWMSAIAPADVADRRLA